MKLCLRLLPVVLLSAACQERRVGDALAAAVQRGAGTSVQMAAVAPFPWTRLYVFPPYSAPDRITGTLGFPWVGATSAINHSDLVSLLVFVHDRRVVASVEHPRAQGDLAALYRPEGYARDSATFVVQQAGRMVGGAPHWALRWDHQ